MRRMLKLIGIDVLIFGLATSPLSAAPAPFTVDSGFVPCADVPYGPDLADLDGRGNWRISTGASQSAYIGAGTMPAYYMIRQACITIALQNEDGSVSLNPPDAYFDLGANSVDFDGDLVPRLFGPGQSCNKWDQTDAVHMAPRYYIDLHYHCVGFYRSVIEIWTDPWTPRQ